MRNLLISFIDNNSTDFTELMGQVEGMIYETFNYKERVELAAFIKSLRGLMSGMPYLLSDEEVKPKLGHYRFYLLQSGEGYSSRFFYLSRP